MTISALDTYREIEVTSMSPGEIVVAAYSHLLARLERARTAADPAGYQEALSEAQSAVLELLTGIDKESGGSLATNLAALYGFFLNEILSLSVTPAEARLLRLIEMTTGLTDAWREATTHSMAGSIS